MGNSTWEVSGSTPEHLPLTKVTIDHCYIKDLCFADCALQHPTNQQK